VTGGTGLVGNNVVRALVEGGAEVRVLSRRPPRREFAGLPVEEVPGDLDDAPSLRRAFADVGCVVHAAAMVEIRLGGREAMAAVNVEGTRRVLAALPPGCRLVHVSTVDALGMRSREHPADEDCAPQPHEEGVPYVDTKRAADRLVQESEADAVIVYPTYMLGPWDWRPSSGKMLLEIASGRGLFAPPGGNNFVDVRDVAAGILAAAAAPSRGRWILGGENLSYLEAWTLMAEVTGGRKPLGTLPRWATGAAAGVLDLGRRLGLKEGEINAAAVHMSTLPHYFDPARARRELGLPASPLRNAIADAWAWFGEQGMRG
jgi:dihydroflavonol-4-reductase